MENLNIYNALKPSEVTKIYEDAEISPTEASMINTKEHQDYKQKQTEKALLGKTVNNVYMGAINDIPKTDLKQRFKNNIQAGNNH